MLIEVTENHITYGISGDCRYCVIALAIDEHLPETSFAHVSGDQVYFYANGVQSGQCWLADDVKEFIKRFDAGQKVEPQCFEIRIPPQLVKKSE